MVVAKDLAHHRTEVLQIVGSKHNVYCYTCHCWVETPANGDRAEGCCKVRRVK